MFSDLGNALCFVEGVKKIVRSPVAESSGKVVCALRLGGSWFETEITVAALMPVRVGR